MSRMVYDFFIIEDTIKMLTDYSQKCTQRNCLTVQDHERLGKIIKV